MKNLITVFLLVTFLLTGSIGHGEPCYRNGQTPAGHPASIVVKGILYHDEVIPSIQLPEVEIIGDLNLRKNLVGAELIDGEVVPMILLDEVVITPSI